MPEQPDRGGAVTVQGALRQGERLTETVDVGTGTVGVTDQRVLVSRKSGNVRAVDRTNVRSVRERTISERGSLFSAVQWAVLGGFLLLARRVAPLDALAVTVDRPPDVGFGRLFEAVNQLLGALEYLELAFLVAGLITLAWSARRLVGYVRGRRRVLEVTVVGADPARVPAPEDPGAVDRLQEALSIRTGDGPS
jgi:hypothetical protein